MSNIESRHREMAQQSFIRALKVGVVVVSVVTATLWLSTGHDLVTKTLTEDGYYALTISRNIAQGKGITIDGTTWTNGFQPLYTFINVPCFFFAGADTAFALRIVVALHWIFYIMTGILLGLIARNALAEKDEQRPLLFWLATFFYLSSLYIFHEHTNGLETGFLLFMYCVTWRYYQIHGQDLSICRTVVFGIILGFLVLTRIDAAIFVVIVAVSQLLSARERTQAKLTRFVLIGGMSFLVSSPWWTYNLFLFGSLMPSGGAAQQSFGLSLLRLRQCLFAISQDLVPWIWLSRHEDIYSDILRTLIAAVGLLLFWRFHREILRLDLDLNHARWRTIAFGTLILLSVFCLVVWYTLSSYAFWFYHRYFAPILLVAVLLLSCSAVSARVRFPRAIPILSILMMFPLVLWFCWAHLLAGGMGDPIEHENSYSPQLALVREFVPADEFVAAGQTGGLGFFRAHVVNLDGKVNQEARAFQDRMWLYLIKKDIRWVCDEPHYITRYLGVRPEERGWKKMGAKAGHVIYHRADSKDTGSVRYN